MSNRVAGFPPSVWGSVTWTSLMFIALNYPPEPTEKDILTYQTFFKVLGPVLPCPACSENYKDHAATLGPQHLRSRAALVKWLMQVHNDVNVSKDPPTAALTGEQLRQIVDRHA